MTASRLTLKAATEELKACGMLIASQPGEYRVNYRGGREATAYFTDDLADALSTGKIMAQTPPPPPELPLGPVGRRNSRRGLIMKHNRKIADQRRRRAAKAATL
jgi:hypothetical protein